MEHENYHHYPINVKTKAGVQYSMLIMKIPGESIYVTAKKALRDGETLVDENNS